MSTPTSRPVTSKARGICKYYTTDRGCFAGAKCKFLHGPVATHTPYDQAKICRFYANGFCKRGAKCWFAHTKGKEKEIDIDEEDDLCSICFDKPVTYGLLTGCNHIFCITCIKQWRDPVNKSVDVVDSGNIKRCPMCRQPAKFIIPSSKFYAQGEAKDAAMARYLDSMKRVPCKHFQKSLASARATPFCPFGKDCFYQHRNLDGSDHISTQGIDACMRVRASNPLFEFHLIHLHSSNMRRSATHSDYQTSTALVSFASWKMSSLRVLVWAWLPGYLAFWTTERTTVRTSVGAWKFWPTRCLPPWQNRTLIPNRKARATRRTMQCPR
ncbi:hypothetical protein B0H12DRAFT_790343 [Mycena haematopus]|nr:hypothetical protein B0H12DRAFT_790343 [Mycena haematopus]